MTKRRPKGKPERLGTLLTRLELTPELKARLGDLAIWQKWEQAVGTTIASKATPLRLIGGTLTVQVNSAPWMQQLSFMKNELRNRLNEALGGVRIKEISLKLGYTSRKESHEPEEAVRRPKPLAASAKSWINQQVSDLEDPELKELMKELMEQHYSYSK